MPQPDFDLLGLGMSVIDLIQVVEEFPSQGGITEALESSLMGGGPVPTAICAASRLGTKVGIIDRIGADWRGRQIRDEYESFGVDTGALQLEDGKSTTMGAVLVRRGDGERHIVYSPGTFTPLEKGELSVELLCSCRFLHLNGRHWPACIYAAEVVREAGGKVSFDGGANRYRDELREILPFTDILVVAHDFACRLSGAEEPDEQLKALSEWDAELVGVTWGEKGSWFRTREGEVFHQEAFPVRNLVDTTGCGDVFHGAFLFARSRGNDWKSCAKIASAAAAFSAGALGGRGHLPDRTELAELMRESI